MTRKSLFVLGTMIVCILAIVLFHDIISQYVRWLAQFLHGDIGVSTNWR